MDQMRDFEGFKRLVMRLSVTFDKFANDELIESWWKALRHERLSDLERRVDAFIAQAGEKTRFPKPAQFRATEAASFDPREEARDAHVKFENAKNWRELIAAHPRTGAIRLAMAHASRIIASTHESSPAHTEAIDEYLALEKQLGPLGRFAADGDTENRVTNLGAKS
jgi:hypothetical protein